MTKITKSKNYKNVYSYETQQGIRYMFRMPYYDELGKRREKAERKFKSEQEAYKAALNAEVLAANGQASRLVGSTVTVEQWTKKFVKMNESKWRPNYKKNIDTCVENYILPLLGKYQLNKLTKMEYSYLYLQPQLEHLKPSSVRMNHRYFMIIMNAAVENEIIPRNKLKGQHFKKSPRRLPFSIDDLKRFNGQLKKETLQKEAYFTTLEMTGMRLGEGLGLEWSDIDFKKKTISIKRARGRFGIGPTKTPSSVRTISIDESLVGLLHRFSVQEKYDYLRSGQSYDDDKLVFNFTPVSAHNYFKEIIKSAGIQEGRYVIHSLRHTHATLLISAGVSPVDVANRLGHSDPAITLSIYAHAVKDNDANNAKIFAKIVNE
ncbi:site-specific integrase [Levilactobacillus enshiensis]|uniref:site-specific integrase n=1 Tax=Levilactobacillus enshiensis TaxID=2590213 RepID=UPI00117A4308|nr:site-specific integrase [Levilactobacillus enshiensis]